MDNMKLYPMLQEVDIDDVSNFFNILFKNKLLYKLIVIRGYEKNRRVLA